MLEAASYYQIRCRSSATEVEALDANTALLCALAATHLADAMSSSIGPIIDSVNWPIDEPKYEAGKSAATNRRFLRTANQLREDRSSFESLISSVLVRFY